jgi:hypothetical protein
MPRVRPPKPDLGHAAARLVEHAPGKLDAEDLKPALAKPPPIASRPAADVEDADQTRRRPPANRRGEASAMGIQIYAD